ncbi:MAG: bifunctional DNA-formamidopyrimidine glycosylase/DNA-(apurinic or apyrimidinic site) lyase [Paraperlucidibaca sp.]
MPELPEVETTRRGLAPHCVGRRIREVNVHNARLRWPVPDNLADVLAGRVVQSIERRGKYLLLSCKAENSGHVGVLMVHLGMSGSLRLVEPGTARKTHDHLVFCLSDRDDDLDAEPRWELRYHDPRRFGCCLWLELPVEQHPLLASLGPEPLTEAFDDQHLFRLSRGKAMPIKSFLMDSHVVVGVGNIYANEVLFRVGIHPLREAGRVSQARYVALSAAVREILTQAIERGGTTLRDFVNGQGEPGYFQQELSVYGRANEPCRRCTKALTEVRLSARSTVFCTRCQR